MNQQITQRTVIDKETGEVLQMESVKQFTTKTNVEKFYMTFIDYISPFYNLKTQSAKDVLIWMCQHAEFNTGKIVLAAGLRKQMCEELSITTNTISNSLKKLAELKLISGDSGVYIINPQIFWKGDLKTRNEMLNIEEIKVTFDLKFKND